MFLKTSKTIIALLAVLFFVLPFFVKASSLYLIRDLITSSWPGASTTHLLDFSVGQAVPPEGSITVDFQAGSVNMPASFDISDIDFQVATSGLDYLDREIGVLATGTIDGVSLTTGTSASLTIDLNPTVGLGVGDKVRLKLGTNASYGGIGSNNLINPLQKGVYGVAIKSYDNFSSLLDNGMTFIVMIDPVTVTTTMPRVRGNGIPDGVLAPGTIMTIMSLTTNYDAVCRYSDASSTPYSSMTEGFFTTDNRYHTTLLSGLIPGRHYAFYVRCFDQDYLVANIDDYVIDFSIAVSGEGGEGGGEGGGDGTGTGEDVGDGVGGSGGGTGGGGGGGMGPRSGTNFPYPVDEEAPPDLTLSGWAYPSSKTTILKDGQQYKDIFTKNDGSFSLAIEELTKGLYTFGIWALDPIGNRSVTYTSTFWIEENTQTNVANILMPPTIILAQTSVDQGQGFDVSGYATPGQRVEVEVFKPDVRGTKVEQTEVGSDGTWRILFPTDGLTEGQYKMRARTIFKDLGSSIYSHTLDCGVGQSAEGDNCSRSDINKDGKVNLIDFSIMLFNWGSNNFEADINRDGTVNLIDFSIMLFCWTG